MTISIESPNEKALNERKIGLLAKEAQYLRKALELIRDEPELDADQMKAIADGYLRIPFADVE